MLQECVGSILRLPMGDAEREVILVDDGSEESPLPQLQEYKDRIVYIRQANGGLGAARNTGIQAARGTYIQFVDADDYLQPEAYQHCIEAIRQSRETDMLLFQLTSHPSSSVPRPSSATTCSGTEYLRHHNLRASACGYLFRKTTLGDLHFATNLLHEDELFTPLLMLRADHVTDLQVAPYYYRQRPNSITHSQAPATQARRLDDMEAIIYQLEKTSGSLPAYEGHALLRRVHQLTMDYIYNLLSASLPRRETEDRLSRLRAKGLFPLPAADYTRKYKWFRRLSTHALGRFAISLKRRLP